MESLEYLLIHLIVILQTFCAIFVRAVLGITKVCIINGIFKTLNVSNCCKDTLQISVFGFEVQPPCWALMLTPACPWMSLAPSFGHCCVTPSQRKAGALCDTDAVVVLLGVTAHVTGHVLHVSGKNALPTPLSASVIQSCYLLVKGEEFPGILGLQISP